jgi:hypothetical protein
VERPFSFAVYLRSLFHSAPSLRESLGFLPSPLPLTPFSAEFTLHLPRSRPLPLPRPWPVTLPPADFSCLREETSCIPSIYFVFIAVCDVVVDFVEEGGVGGLDRI